MQTNKLRSALTVAITVVLLLGGAASANAAPEGPSASAKANSQRSTTTNADCMAQLKKASSQVSTELCTSIVVLEVSEATAVTSGDLADAKSTMSESEYASLVAAAATSAVYSKNYSQTISQITDQERQYGKFYYNGTRAWVTTSYAGYKGTHYCVVDYAVGYSITKNWCSDGGSLAQRTLQMSWHFSVFVNGGPISWSETYTMYVNRSGAIWQ